VATDVVPAVRDESSGEREIIKKKEELEGREEG
jgi:hypothetical protein